MARYEVLNHRKQQARDARLVFSDELEETFAEEIADLGNHDMERKHEALKQCLTRLRPADRELIMHRYAKAGTLQEFAAQVGRSAGSLKVTLHRLRNTLLGCMEKQNNIGEMEA